MSEIIKNRLKESEGKVLKIFLINGFHYTGKFLNSDDDYLEILDFKTDNIKILKISEINDLEVKE